MGCSYSTVYRDVTGQARGDSSLPCCRLFPCGRGNGVVLFKSPPSPWLGESGLALPVLLRDCPWLG